MLAFDYSSTYDKLVVRIHVFGGKYLPESVRHCLCIFWPALQALIYILPRTSALCACPEDQISLPQAAGSIPTVP